MRHRLVLTRSLLLTMGLLGLFTTFLTSTGECAARRGDFPHCQEECLAEHQRYLQKLIKDFEEKRNRVEFQDCAEDAVNEYRRCIENCREPHPVK